MGGELWSNFTPYQENVAEALEELRQQEFAAGRYHGAEESPATIQAAFEVNDASGTGSVLDMYGVSDVPRNPDWDVHEEFCLDFDSDEDPMMSLVAPLAPRQIVELFGTDRPTREVIESNCEYQNLLDRGMGLYLVVYANEVPSELFFAGISYD